MQAWVVWVCTQHTCRRSVCDPHVMGVADFAGTGDRLWARGQSPGVAFFD